MLLHGPYNERVIIFEPIMNILINTIFVIISLILIFLGYERQIYPLIMFIFSITLCHLNDTLTKLLIIGSIDRRRAMNICYYLTITIFFLWYVGSYFVLLSIICNYTLLALFLGCIVTFLYTTILILYLSIFSNIYY